VTSDVSPGSAHDAEDAAKTVDAGKARHSPSWVQSTQAARWAVALLLVLGALGVFCYWLSSGTELACQVVTVSNGAGGTPTKSTTTSTCGLPDIADFAYVLTVVAVLLLPDAQRLRIGGFEFERLSGKLDDQAQQLGRLSQQIANSITVNVGADQNAHDREGLSPNLIDMARDGFRERKDILDEVRGFLPESAELRDQLSALDHLEQRINAESWPDLIRGTLTADSLIEEARKAAADTLVRISEAADTADGEARSEQADSVISDYL